MARRLLSHLLITLAVFSLTATFFIFVIDMTVLNPDHLTKALRDGGVPSAIATILPDQAFKDDSDTSGSNGNGGSSQKTPAEIAKDKADKADMKAKIAAVVTPQYVDQKIQALSTSVLGFMRTGKPSPTLDVSDFPAKLRASGVDTGKDIDKNFATPIDLNKDGKLDVLPQAYSKFKVAKYIGLALTIVFLLAEWFVAAKGDKLHRIGRIFLHAGLWYSIWYAALVVAPSQLLPRLKDKVKPDASISTLIDAFTRSIQHLFSQYFLAFAVVCWVIAIALYAIRHIRKHVDKIQAVPAAKGRTAKKA